jgi:hypothetical protein
LTLVPVRFADKPVADRLVLRTVSGWELSLPLAVDAEWLACVLKRLS